MCFWLNFRVSTMGNTTTTSDTIQSAHETHDKTHQCIHDGIDHKITQQFIKYTNHPLESNNINTRKLLSQQYIPIRICPHYDPLLINTNTLSMDQILYIKSLFSTSIHYLKQFVKVILISEPLLINLCQRVCHFFQNEECNFPPIQGQLQQQQQQQNHPFSRNNSRGNIENVNGSPWKQMKNNHTAASTNDIHPRNVFNNTCNCPISSPILSGTKNPSITPTITPTISPTITTTISPTTFPTTVQPTINPT